MAVISLYFFSLTFSIVGSCDFKCTGLVAWKRGDLGIIAKWCLFVGKNVCLKNNFLKFGNNLETIKN